MLNKYTQNRNEVALSIKHVESLERKKNSNRFSWKHREQLVIIR